jgi:cytochrome-b5 reductase
MQKYTLSEVAKHNTESDCWVVVHGAVVDVTKFLSTHPGGLAALSKPGRGGCDVTEHFERIGHSEKARSIMRSMQIGILIDDDVSPSTSE